MPAGFINIYLESEGMAFVSEVVLCIVVPQGKNLSSLPSPTLSHSGNRLQTSGACGPGSDADRT